jgi:hypothetical protein
MCVLTAQDDGFFGASENPNLQGSSIGLNSPAFFPLICALALLMCETRSIAYHSFLLSLVMPYVLVEKINFAKNNSIV